eukprot:12619063-Alexandrium_andersonii.AAC.1
MSASLVGSEMCIRDSSLRQPTSTCEAGRACGSRVVAVHVHVVRRLDVVDVGDHACLLYTSDAADDM